MTDEEAAARQALAAFAIEPDSLTLAARSENITFKVTTGNDAYSLRLHRPGYHTLEELNAERVWTAALRAAGHPVPDAMTTPDGQSYVAVEAGGETRQAGLTRWTEGDVLEDIVENDGTPLSDRFFRLGEIAADFHAHSALWRAPAGFTRHRLDADGLMGEAPFWGPFWDHPRLSAPERALTRRTQARLHAALSRLPQGPEHFGMIHADLHQGNLLVSGPRMAVIDFDDAGFGWYLYDLAVALNHQEGRPGFRSLQDALLRGYRSRRPLSAEDEARLPMFLLVRRLAILGWLHQRPDVDPDAYFTRLKAAVMAGCDAFVEPPEQSSC